MKKYLLLGFAALAFVSCSKDNFSSNDGVPAGYQSETEKSAKYESAFTKAFGVTSVNETVNWGFSPVSVPTLSTETSNENTLTAHAARRVVFANNNQWGSKYCPYYFPDNVTTEEAAKVLEYFEALPALERGVNVNWKNFYAFQVHKGTTQYKDGAGNVFTASDKMNQLWCYKKPNMTDGEHIYNFNSGNNTSSSTTDTGGEGKSYRPGYTIKGGQLMLNSGTADFAYSNSNESGRMYNEHIIIPGTEIFKGDAAMLAKYGQFYYVGFDFRSESSVNKDVNTNENVERDYKYTDWIVRISPAEPFMVYPDIARRIMGEDLIASSLTKVNDSDLDFNDVVFDVEVYNKWFGDMNANKLVAHVILRAAGGTMPLYIGQLDEKYEVHKLFGVDTKCMVNTHAKNHATGEYTYVDGLPAVDFEVIIGDAIYNDLSSYDYVNIPIYVGGQVLNANLGKAAHKLCVPVTTKWMNEKTKLITGYPDFTKYVENGTPTDWYKTTGSGLYE